MRKLRTLIIAMMIVPCMVLLAACGGGGGGGSAAVDTVTVNGEGTVIVNQEVTYTATVAPTNAANATVAWSIVSGGTATATINSSSGLFKATTTGTVTIRATAGGKTGDKVITVNNDDPVKQGAGTHFSGAKVTYSNSAIADPLGGTSTFTNLLDRQLDAMAQELLVRLGKVYGQIDSNDYQVQQLRGVLDFAGVVVNAHNVIVEADSYLVGFPIFNLANGQLAHNYNALDLDDAKTYASYLAGGTFLLLDGIATSPFNFQNAIQGGYSFTSGAFTTTLETAKAWTLTYTTTGFNLTEWLNAHHSTVKLGLANALAGTTDLSLAEAMSNINKIGFDTTSRNTVIDYVKTSIIGTTAWNTDVSSTPVPVSGSYDILTGLSHSNQLTTGHTFKNYQVLVPAIVDSIFAQKLRIGSELLPTGANAYPTADRIITADTTLAATNTDRQEYSQIMLKANNNTPITKMEIKVSAGAIGGGNHAYTLKMQINRGGTTTELIDVTPTDFKVTSSGTNTYTIDLAEHFPDLADLTLNAFTGTNNYILLQFIPTASSVPFGVEFTGYYNKN